MNGPRIESHHLSFDAMKLASLPEPGTNLSVNFAKRILNPQSSTREAPRGDGGVDAEVVAVAVVSEMGPEVDSDGGPSSEGSMVSHEAIEIPQ